MKAYYADYYLKLKRNRSKPYRESDKLRQRQRRKDNPELAKIVSKKCHKKNSERHIWRGIINRCTDHRRPGYKNYGGRGISICERWMTFENFLEDMGKRPSVKHSVDRRDNDGWYCPENCYWATRAQQSRNTRRTRFLEFNGKRQCMTDWAHELGVNPALLATRLNLLKWPVEKALTTGPSKAYVEV
jgi:hypothetical protein